MFKYNLFLVSSLLFLLVSASFDVETNRYLVVFKKDVEPEQLRIYTDTFMKSDEKWFSFIEKGSKITGFSAYIPENHIRILAKDSIVDYIEKGSFSESIAVYS